MSPLSIIGLLVAAPSVSAAAWSVLQARFSAVSIGLGFHDAQTGWTTFTDGSSAPKIVKTEDGGKSFSPVNSSGTVVLPTGFAASHGGVLKHVGSVGLLANDYSLDGDNFKTSLSPVIVSQSIKYEADRFIVAAPSGAACHSTEGAVFFCSSKAPLLNNGCVAVSRLAGLSAFPASLRVLARRQPAAHPVAPAGRPACRPAHRSACLSARHPARRPAPPSPPDALSAGRAAT
jgi:hypothetical protein